MIKIFFFIFIIFLFLYCNNKLIDGGNSSDNLFNNINIFYINLEKDKDRDKIMKKNIKRLNLNATRIEGIDGKKYKNEDKLKLNKEYSYKINTKFLPSNSNRGCNLSHIYSILKIKELNLDYGIICEDDLDFSIIEKDKTKIKDIIKKAPKNWSLIKLHSSHPTKLEQYNKEYLDNKIEFVKVIPYEFTNYSCMCYIINKNYIEEFFKKYNKNNILFFEQNYFVSDITMYFSDNMYAYTKPLFKSNNFISSRMGHKNEYDIISNNLIDDFWNKYKLKGGSKNILDKIDKIYFINLDKSKDRLDLMLKYGKDLNLKLKRFPAVYGKDLNKDKLIEQGILDKNNKLNKGEIGCFLSHVNIWKEAIKKNYEHILILEDDIVFTDNFKNNFIKYYNQVPNDWEIIHLGGSRIKGKLIKKNIIKPVFAENPDWRYNMGTYAMLLNKKGIQKLLNIVLPINNPIDLEIAINNKKLNIYYFEPKLIIPNNDFYSEISLIKNNKKQYYQKNETHSNATIVKGGSNKIPKVIYICYKTKNIPEYIIPNWKKLNPDYKIKLYDNQDCIDFLEKEFGSEYVDTFNYIKDGPIKADFWRCCIIYKYGGIYADIDIKPVKPMIKIY